MMHKREREADRGLRMELLSFLHARAASEVKVFLRKYTK